LTLERLKEIITLADKLNWIYPIDQPNKRKFSYPLLQLSEVEKCMIAMYDDNQLEQMRRWVNDEKGSQNKDSGMLK
jgi:hypothetical protein